jgi:hypothetical protein
MTMVAHLAAPQGTISTSLPGGRHGPAHVIYSTSRTARVRHNLQNSLRLIKLFPIALKRSAVHSRNHENPGHLPPGVYARQLARRGLAH